MQRGKFAVAAWRDARHLRRFVMAADEFNLQVNRKALELNLDRRIYGTFAEIGAGQEVARRFFFVGAAAGTVALSWVSATTVKPARTPPNQTAATGLKLTPRTTTESPGAPTHESRLSMIGPGPTTTN